MKQIFLLIAFAGISGAASAQEFTKQATTARTAYTAGKLDDSRFAMQQMLQELDMMTGKEIVKLLPQKMEDKAAVATNDNVSGASGWAGVVVHREYGTGDKNIDLEIITNSPLIGSLNAMLSLPFVANNADQKVVRIEGYKALVQKVSGDNGTSDYELQLPLSNTLITLKAPGYSQDQVIKMAGTLPVADIAKMVQ
jgi:hypothetical protein